MSRPEETPLYMFIDRIRNIRYIPESQSLLLEIPQTDHGTDYLQVMEISPPVLREILLALRHFADQSGTSIEDLARPHSFQ